MPWLRCWAWTVLLVLGPSLFPFPGSAQSDADADYHALVNQALTEFRLRNWPEARVLFRNAHDLSPNARTLRGMGMVSYEMRDYVECIRELRASLANDVQPLTAAQRGEVTQLLERAGAFVGSYQVRIEPQDLAAEVDIDGETPVRESDGSMLLALGQHDLQVRAESHLSYRTTLEVQGGERETVLIELEPAAPVLAEAEPQPPPVPAPAPHEPAQSQPPPGLRWTWVGLGASAAFGAATAAVWFVGQAKLDERVAACEDLRSSCDDSTQDLQTLSTLTTVGWALTGAALAASVVAFSLEWRARKVDRTIELGLGPTALQLRGHF